MADFHRSFIKAMDLIEDARQAGHLIDAEHYYEKYRNSSDKSYIQQAFDGVTSNPLFEQFSGLQWTYVIKSGVSASYAINHLLQEHETYIECGVALNISHYLIVLWAMEEVHGKEQGSKRFDSLFGQADAVTPSNRRLIINPANILMGTSIPSDMKQLPVHPLSFFSEKSQGVDKQKINNFAKVGDMIVFLGDPNYVKIHPAGMHAIYNCVITSLNPIKVRCFDLGKQELTQEDLYQQHQQAYSAVPLLESFALLDKNFRNSLEFIELITQPTSPEKIPGFYNRLFSINQEKFN